MRRKGRYIVFVVVVLGSLIAWVHLSGATSPSSSTAATIGRPARIYPDYNDVTIPPNIAPLNFRIEEDAKRYRVRIGVTGAGTFPVDIRCKSPDVVIPEGRWRRLLESARGKDISIDVLTADESGLWQQYQSIPMTVSADPIDSHVVYRLLHPVHNYYTQLGIYQRDLESYEESRILQGRQYDNGCLNCHSFCSNDPSRMFVAIRSTVHGNMTLLADGSGVRVIDTPLGDLSWHPSGKFLTFSRYDVRQFFHSASAEVRDVIELDSLLGYYRIEDNRARPIKSAMDKTRLEKMPVWSPDGKYLYFLSAPKLWPDRKTVPPERFAEVRYDLLRASYDIETDTWGEAETVLSAEKTGKSILAPRFTPDGRFIVFTMCDYGCFSIYRPDSDLYIMDVQTREYEKLDCNSERTDSWHTISSNGRWMVFSSKRNDGVFTRLYITHLDENGKTTKPFIMPQKDPGYYDAYLNVYNVPELITGPVTVPNRWLVDAVRDGDRVKVDALTAASPKVDAAPDFWKPTGQ